VIAGPAKKSRVISEDEKKLVAYHEAGHTICGYFLKNADMVHKVTIIPRGSAGGYTVMLPKEDRFFATKSDLLDKIVGLLGGRVAEELVLKEVSTGAHNDFERATGIARRMVMEFGMSTNLGPMQFGQGQGQVFLGRDFGREQNYSDETARQIDQEIQNIIRDCHQRCTELLTEKMDKLEAVAQALLQYETLDAEQIKSIIETGEIKGNVGEVKEVTTGEVKVQITGKSEDAAPTPGIDSETNRGE
jgi:cell division protease FtsH